MITSVRRALKKAKGARDYEKALYGLVDIFVQLDAGMVAGQVVSEEVRRSVSLGSNTAREGRLHCLRDRESDAGGEVDQ